MQITDMLNQYNQNTATGATATSPQQGVQQLVSAVRAMTVGNVFEGTVNEMRHGQAILGLSNGQTITAKIAGNVSMSVGQSMFFQVKSNDGATVEIRPYTNGNLNNPTLLKALDAAGITAEPSTIEMVNSMMEEQLPIDRKSLQDMARMISGHGNVDVKTLVMMSKLDIPLTEEYIEQFSNYKNDQAAITSQFDAVLDSLGEVYGKTAMTDGQAAAVNSRIVDVLLQGAAEASLQAEAAMSPESVLSGTPEASWSPVEVITASQQPILNAEQMIAGEEVLDIPEAAAQEQVMADSPIEDNAVRYYPQNTLGALLNDSQVQSLTEQLRAAGGLDALLGADGKLNLSLTTEEFLAKLQYALTENQNDSQGTVRKLLSGKEYQSVLRNVAEAGWLLKPQDVKADNINKLYNRLEAQLQQMQQMIKETGQEHTPLAKSVAQLQGNVEFMNEIGNAYHYVQIPLKMAGQNAQSELYVYTNKKNMEQPEGDLSAFLHLDMDYLGPTDVSVHMRDRKVHTDFFMEDDKSFALIEEHMTELAQRLEEKGYSCTVHVENHGRKMNFVDDFLKKDRPAAGILHRYSFDVRA